MNNDKMSTNDNNNKEQGKEPKQRTKEQQQKLDSYHRNKEARRAKCREKVICDVCNGIVSRENLKRHQKNPKCELMRAIREKAT